MAAMCCGTFCPDRRFRPMTASAWLGLMLLVYLGGGLLGKLIYPVIGFFDSILMRV